MIIFLLLLANLIDFDQWTKTSFGHKNIARFKKVYEGKIYVKING